MSENSAPSPAAAHGAWTPEGEVPPPAPQRPSEDTIVSMLKTVFDPEIPVDIFELGLIYAVEIADDGGDARTEDNGGVGFPIQTVILPQVDRSCATIENEGNKVNVVVAVSWDA